MRPEEVLELMRSGNRRCRSVRAALRYRGDGPTMRTLRDRYLKSEKPRAQKTGGSPDPSGEVGYPEPNGPFGWSCRVWYAKVRTLSGARAIASKWRSPEKCIPKGGYISGLGREGRALSAATIVDSRIGGGPREEDPPWLSLAQDSFWNTYLFDLDGIAGFPLRQGTERGRRDTQGGPRGHPGGGRSGGGLDN